MPKRTHSASTPFPTMLPSLTFFLLPTDAFKATMTTMISPRHSRISNTTPSISTLISFMGIYDSDEIDWDADLFGKIGRKLPEDVVVASSASGESLEQDDDEWAWDDNADNSPNFLPGQESINSMRKEMKEAWSSSGTSGKWRGSDDVKPNADWMPNYGNVPNEDEPWFTG